MEIFLIAIVDKTAAFVARNGVDFENKIREKEAANPRFSFLNATDPYNAYYQHKVTEFREGLASEPVIHVCSFNSFFPFNKPQIIYEEVKTLLKFLQFFISLGPCLLLIFQAINNLQRPQIPEAVKEHVKQAEFIPRNPPPPFEFDADPATINAFDLLAFPLVLRYFLFLIFCLFCTELLRIAGLYFYFLVIL